MLGDWRHRHGRDFDVLVLPIAAILVMLLLAVTQGRYSG
jgi:hypothetical protein